MHELTRANLHNSQDKVLADNIGYGCRAQAVHTSKRATGQTLSAKDQGISSQPDSSFCCDEIVHTHKPVKSIWFSVHRVQADLTGPSHESLVIPAESVQS